MSSSRTGMQDSQQMEHDQAQMSGEDSQDMTVGYADEEESSRGGAGKMIVGVVLVAILAIIIGCCACGGSKEEEVKEAADEGAVQATEEEPNQGFLAPSAEGEVAESSEQSEGCPMWVILTSAIGGAVVVIVTTVIICCCCCGSSQSSVYVFDDSVEDVSNQAAKVQLAKYTEEMKKEMGNAASACTTFIDACHMKEADKAMGKALCAAAYANNVTFEEVKKDKLKGLKVTTSLDARAYEKFHGIFTGSDAGPESTLLQAAEMANSAMLKSEKKTDEAAKKDMAEAAKKFTDAASKSDAAREIIFMRGHTDSILHTGNLTFEGVPISADIKAEELKKKVNDEAAKAGQYSGAYHTVKVDGEKYTLEGGCDPVSALELGTESKAEETTKETPAKK